MTWKDFDSLELLPTHMARAESYVLRYSAHMPLTSAITDSEPVAAGLSMDSSSGRSCDSSTIKGLTVWAAQECEGRGCSEVSL
eukprot:5653686-Amphidinium_carterae.1